MSEYYYTQGSDRHGPIGLAELQELVSAGQVSTTDYYWTAGMGDWATFRDAELFSGPKSPANDTPTSAATATDALSNDPPVTDAPAWESPSALTSTPAATQSPVAATSAWSPTPDASTTVTGSTDRATVQRIANSMPKPIWLLIIAVGMGLAGVVSIFGVITIPIAALYIWLAVLLFQANSSLENARQTGSFESLEKAARNINTYFAVLAVLLILGVVFAIGFIALGFGLSEFSL